MKLLRSAAPWISALALLVTGSAQASEDGGSTYNPGVDNAGNSAVPGVELNAKAAATWFITAQLQKEMNARNRPEGTALWSKTIISF